MTVANVYIFNYLFFLVPRFFLVPPFFFFFFFSAFLDFFDLFRFLELPRAPGLVSSSTPASGSCPSLARYLVFLFAVISLPFFLAFLPSIAVCLARSTSSWCATSPRIHSMSACAARRRALCASLSAAEEELRLCASPRKSAGL